MSTVDERDGELVACTPRARPRQLLRAATTIVWRRRRERPLADAERPALVAAVDGYAAQGLRVLGVARRRLGADGPLPDRREDAERDLCLLGLVGDARPAAARGRRRGRALPRRRASGSSSSPATTG